MISKICRFINLSSNCEVVLLTTRAINLLIFIIIIIIVRIRIIYSRSRSITKSRDIDRYKISNILVNARAVYHLYLSIDRSIDQKKILKNFQKFSISISFLSFRFLLFFFSQQY